MKKKNLFYKNSPPLFLPQHSLSPYMGYPGPISLVLICLLHLTPNTQRPYISTDVYPEAHILGIAWIAYV